MKRPLLWALALGFSVQAFAQDPSAQKFARQISAVKAKKHLSILASDEFEGRETGTRGAEKAAAYIAAQFKKLGLQAPVNGSYFQDIALVSNTFAVQSFSVNGTAYSLGKDFYFSGTPEARTIQAGEIVFIGYGIDDAAYSDLKDTDISGKVVMLIAKGEPMKEGISALTKSSTLSEWSQNRTKRIQFIQSKNPALIISVNPDVAAMLEKNPESYTPTARLAIKGAKPKAGKAGAPVVNIAPALANQFLKNSGKTYESLKEMIDNSSAPQTQTLKSDFSTSFGLQSKDVKAVNVMGLLPGTDLKDEVLVFSAHYDHIGLTTTGPDKINNGADDDGSGTTGVLTIAKAFVKAKKAGKGPRRSILFLTVVGEEKGLLGSEWYSEHPVLPLEKTVTDLNIDMIGRVDPNHESDPNYCYLIGSDKLSTDLHKISENANATYTKFNIDYKYNDPKDPERIYYRSDHYNFAKHNIPIIFYFNGVHADYHKPSDEVSKINFPLLAKRAQLVFYTGWEVANRDKRPVVDVTNDMPASR